MNIINITDVKEKIKDNEPHFVIAAMCMLCRHKWIGAVHYETSLFTLECPKCEAQDSFASILPNDYLEANGANG